MIEAKELSDKPLRQGNTDACLLVSYATALFPFTQIPEIQYFIDCCSLLGIKLTTPGDAMTLLKPLLIDNRIGTSRKNRGYDWIEDLHLNCPGYSFNRARMQTNLLRLSRDETEQNLNGERCSSIFALHFPNGLVHSVCVIKDSSYGYVVRDSGQLMRNPEPRFDETGATLEQLFLNLYKMTGIDIGESILIIEK